MRTPKTVETYDWLVAGQVKGPVPLAPLPAALAAWSSEGGHVELTRVQRELGSDDDSLRRRHGRARSERLQPVGAFSAVVRGYNEAVDAAVARGFMTPAQGTAAKLWLSARAEKDERGFKVKLPLTIQDGFLSMGPIKLAQVPRDRHGAGRTGVDHAAPHVTRKFPNCQGSAQSRCGSGNSTARPLSGVQSPRAATTLPR